MSRPITFYRIECPLRVEVNGKVLSEQWAPRLGERKYSTEEGLDARCRLGNILADGFTARLVKVTEEVVDD